MYYNSTSTVLKISYPFFALPIITSCLLSTVSTTINIILCSTKKIQFSTRTTYPILLLYSVFYNTFRTVRCSIIHFVASFHNCRAALFYCRITESAQSQSQSQSVSYGTADADADTDSDSDSSIK
jgi:hypothetical protein